MKLKMLCINCDTGNRHTCPEGTVISICKKCQAEAKQRRDEREKARKAQ